MDLFQGSALPRRRNLKNVANAFPVNAKITKTKTSEVLYKLKESADMLCNGVDFKTKTSSLFYDRWFNYSITMSNLFLVVDSSIR